MLNLKSVLLITFLLAIFCAELTVAIERCQIDSPETHQARIARNSEDFERAKKKKAQKKKNAKKPVVEPVYELRVLFHVLQDSKGKEGRVPVDSILANIENANKVLSGAANTRGRGVDSKIRLVLAGITYTNNTDWFTRCSDYNVAGDFKLATALYAASHVNVWTCKSDTLLGWVHFLPYELTQHSVWNGVNINYKSLPLSKSDRTYENYGDYADGDTFTHEFGHYLGLLHTFGDGVNGCNRGDGVDDTPAEKTPASGKACRANPPIDTCPDQPGVDPNFNLMDYADDSCAEELTPGQIDVMRYSIEQYKPNLAIHEPPRCVTDGERGTAKPLTLCKSECFLDRSAPDGRMAPTGGWCRTDSLNWGSCSCAGDLGGRPVVPYPVKLPCGRVQAREELFKPSLASNRCTFADIGGGATRQVYQATCNQSPFGRWAFNYDGTITNIGTGYCLTVLDWESPTRVDGKRLGIAPCMIMAQSQRFTVLSEKGVAGQLQLYAAPQSCVDVSDGTFQMRQCTKGVPSQVWVRKNKPNCGSLKKRPACVSSTSTLGCACRWVKKRCMS